MNLLSNINIFDHQLALSIFSLRLPAWDRFFLVFTYLGEWLVVTILLLFLLLLGYRFKETFIGWFAILVVALSGLTSILLKFLVNRSRPSSEIALYSENLASFPSAHAALILSFWGFLTYVIWRTRHHLSTKIFFSLISLIIIGLIGFSRLYLGVHFFSDIIGGYLVGLLWLLLTMYWSRSYFK